MLGLMLKRTARKFKVDTLDSITWPRRGTHVRAEYRQSIEAMGGQLEVIARFPDGAVKISNFGDLALAVVSR